MTTARLQQVLETKSATHYPIRKPFIEVLNEVEERLKDKYLCPYTHAIPVIPFTAREKWKESKEFSTHTIELGALLESLLVYGNNKYIYNSQRISPKDIGRSFVLDRECVNEVDAILAESKYSRQDLIAHYPSLTLESYEDLIQLNLSNQNKLSTFLNSFDSVTKTLRGLIKDFIEDLGPPFVSLVLTVYISIYHNLQWQAYACAKPASFSPETLVNVANFFNLTHLMGGQAMLCRELYQQNFFYPQPLGIKLSDGMPIALFAPLKPEHILGRHHKYDSVALMGGALTTFQIFTTLYQDDLGPITLKILKNISALISLTFLLLSIDELTNCFGIMPKLPSYPTDSSILTCLPDACSVSSNEVFYPAEFEGACEQVPWSATTVTIAQCTSSLVFGFGRKILGLFQACRQSRAEKHLAELAEQNYRYDVNTRA